MTLRLASRYLLAVSWLFAFLVPSHAQLSNPNPVPFSGTVPSGTGACSVVKSCAEVAPDIIRQALGSSSFEKNLRYLAGTNGKRPVGSEAIAGTISWAVNAFKLAGVDGAHTEKFPIQSSPGGHGGRGDSMNVIAEIRGRDLPDEFVILAGHLDSTSASGHGAESAAIIIDAARAIHASGSIPRRSVRFVLFTGAEQGMLGGRAYAEAHYAELDRMIAAMGVDGSMGNVMGFSLGGRKETLAAVQGALAPVRSLGAVQFTTDARMSMDTFDFLLEGVPTLVPNVQSPKSTAIHESASGPYDKSTIDALKHQVAIAAVSAYALSDSEGRIGSRQSRDEIERLLENTGLDKQMKTANIWPDWETGKRGRQQ
jgi:Zn-dependent M28 family amino/carboxypeptidase